MNKLQKIAEERQNAIQDSDEVEHLMKCLEQIHDDILTGSVQNHSIKETPIKKSNRRKMAARMQPLSCKNQKQKMSFGGEEMKFSPNFAQDYGSEN